MSEPTRETLTVLAPGLYTLVVDQGRPRTRSLGVPLGGAADRDALALGNALVGNPPDAAALEITLAGPTLRADGPLAGVVLGAPFDLTTPRRRLEVGKTFTLAVGEELHIAGAAEGMRAWLCVRGGLQTPPVLGSRSSLEPLRAGAELPYFPGTIRPRFFRHRFPGDDEALVLHALDGPQADWFAPEAFYRQEFRVAPESNRMGLRLRGRALAVPPRELTSEPVCPGAVQVTRDGQCIVLGVDGQTIGGYPKIAQVATVDLGKLAQLRPGAAVRFRRVGLEEAKALYRARQAELYEWLTRLRTAARSD